MFQTELTGGEFVLDDGVSGTILVRPALERLRDQVAHVVIDRLYVLSPDRLARNSIDGGSIIYMLDRGVIRDLKFATYTFENNSQGKFMLQIMFGQSKYYSDALSDNVKRGNRTKVEKGWRPGKAPIGYLNDIVTKTIVTDPERFPLIRKMFDLMLTGILSPRRVWQVARNEWGFRTPTHKRIGGKPIVLSSVYRILSSPFYAGLLVWNGRTYPGAHAPVVSIEEFERVQILLGKKEKPRPHTHQFAFTGLIRCGECGLLVTAEEKVNRFGSRYTYYHCTRRKIEHRCRQPSVTVQELERQICGFFSSVALSLNFEEWAQKQLRATRETGHDLAEERKRSLQSAIEATERGIANLTSLRIRDLIGDDEFVRERQKLEQDQLRLSQQLKNANEVDETFEPVDALISLRSRALDWFRAGDSATKRLIFDSLGSNPILKDKILNVEAKKPFRRVSNCNTFPELRAMGEDIRTLYVNRDPELLCILNNIKLLETRCGTRSKGNHLLAA